MNEFWKENDLDRSKGDQQVPFIFIKKLTWHMFIFYFSKINDLWFQWFQGDLDALWHPQRPRQAQPSRVQQVPIMFIKIWHNTRSYTIFQRQINVKWSQRDRVIKMLSDTFSDLDKLNHGEYQLC